MVGEKKAREILYLTRQYSADEALAMGLVNAVVPDEELDAEVDSWCEQILRRSPQGLRLAKLAMNTATDALYSSVQHGLELVALNHVYGPEPAEGIASFGEKRPADWRKFREGAGARAGMSAVPADHLLGALRPALRDAVETALEGRRLSDDQALALADARGGEHPVLWAAAAAMRDRGRPPVVTYSRKVFIPLTNLCRDICSYCTFAHTDADPRAHTMSPDEVLAVAEAGRQLGCKEVLFTLGDRPEVRYESHRIALRRFGHDSTHSYLTAMCRMVIEKTGLLPHPNAGILVAPRAHRAARGLGQPGDDAGDHLGEAVRSRADPTSSPPTSAPPRAWP